MSHGPSFSFVNSRNRCLLLQGVFINPALVEPFGLTLIEVSFIFRSLNT
jgi:hypothetical protein